MEPPGPRMVAWDMAVLSPKRPARGRQVASRGRRKKLAFSRSQTPVWERALPETPVSALHRWGRETEFRTRRVPNQELGNLSTAARATKPVADAAPRNS